jgi:hypothetical protein
MDALGEQERRASVPEVVEADVGESGLLQERRKERSLRLDGLIGVPASLVNTKS